jgi:hypothetical protein
MRLAVWFIVLGCFAGSAIGQKNSFQVPCSSHIQRTWPEELRKAAQADCQFFDEAQTSGAAAWVKYASEDAAMKGLNGREQIRAQFENVYKKPGFRLLWYPTKGVVYGSFVVTTGDYERHALDAQGKETVSHGHYVTVWQKQKDGSYLYVWDGGE